MKSLTFALQLNTTGVAEEIEKTSFAEQRFTKPTDILVQAIMCNCFFNRQDKSFWKVEVSIDSWETTINGVKQTHTVPKSTISSSKEILQCTMIKARLVARNGGGTGLLNIYM